MNILGYGNATGAKNWRISDPFKYLRKLGVDAYVSDETITEQAAKWADVVVLSSVVYKEGIALLREYQVEHGLKIVVDCDDYFDLNPDSPFIKEHEKSDAKRVIKKTMEIADMVTTTTKHLAGKLSEINKNVKVLPNYMDMDRWDLAKYHNESDRIRIGWAGSMTHLDDLKMIVEPLIKIKQNYPQVDYIFVGETRIADLFPFPVETMLGVPFDVWPAKLNGLRLDIGLAPLKDTPFNKCKSNIKWLEYSIAQIPGVYSPTVYQHTNFEPKFGLVADSPETWYGAIEHYINYPQRRQEVVDSSYGRVKKFFSLEKHIHEWNSAFKGLIDLNSVK